MTNVIWLNFNDNAPNRGYWDQGLLEDILCGSVWRPTDDSFVNHEVRSVDDMPDIEGAVVVIPGRQQMDPTDNVDKICRALSQLAWCVVIITGDEEGAFPHERLAFHPNMILWVQTPRPGRSWPSSTRFLPVGYPPGFKADRTDKEFDWTFMGQVTHSRREECVTNISGQPNGSLLATEGFTQGIPQEEYWENLAKSKIGLCPGGPVTPDTFRLAETLEAGSVPIADNASAQGEEPAYWQQIFGEVFFPTIDDWVRGPRELDAVLPVWKETSNVVFSRWQQYKRQLAWNLHDDIETLGGYAGGDHGVTVLMATSPIPSHPNMDIFIETLNSVRYQLPDVEIIVMIDGIRDEQVHHHDRYTEYVNRLVHLCNNMENVLPLVFAHHRHQGVMTRRALELVRTSTILFVEHDTPMTTGEIPWETAIDAVSNGDINLLRFHHEAQVHPEHEYLMIDSQPVHKFGLPLRRTVQWSQRPHLANADFYRWVCATYFGWDSRTMIEDVMYGVLETHYREEGIPGWEKLNVWMFTPEGDIKRSNHTDGRSGESKYTLKIAYDDGEQPLWGPHQAVIDT